MQYLAALIILSDFPEEETLLLASILRYSDVMVNMFSTMVVEASIFDLPAINLAVTAGFDSADDGRSRQDITIDYVQTHNQRIIQTGGVRNAFSIDELIDLVNAYLRDPSLDSEGRADIRELEAGPFKGNAGNQIAEHLLALARDT